MIAYAITDSSTLNFQTLFSDLTRFSKQADMIVYRDKFNDAYASYAEMFIREAIKLPFSKILFHSDIELAYKLHADGIHLKSTQLHEIQKAKILGLFVVVSTHTVAEAQKAEELGANMVTYSPIFSSPNKGEPKGVKELKKLVSMLSIPVIALGGIVTQEHITLCETSGAFGFASIRYFA
ncbi:thiamine phosphate synthase [bacterium]|nr:thiamine phosphate synthase [bacterium]MBU1957028.1 thiamine phosphate synthase [bacterium]